MATVINLPKLSDTMEEGGISSWEKKEGDFVAEGDILLEIETDKATMEYASPEEGYLLKIIAKAGSTVALGTAIAVLGKKGEKLDLKKLLKEKPPEEKKEEAPSPKGSKETVSTKTEEKSTRVKASPLAKKKAQEQGVNLETISGSGPLGRIIAQDIKPSSNQNSFASLSDKKIPLTMMRKTIAKRLLEAKNTAPHFYLEVSCNMDQALSWRRHLNNEKKVKENPSIKVSVNDLLVYVVARSLAKHPQVNSSWDSSQIILHGHINVAIAVALDSGLVTPVVENANQKTIWEIATASKNLVKKARNNQLQPQEYSSGTFSISNLGMTRTEKFTAIINPPQAAIIAIGRVKKQAVVTENNEIKIQNQMTMTLSCDHRVIDGMVGSQFLNTLCSYLEEPVLMLQ
jgi:pyruvate dehydrogenase E2 component (dihydrolipoamide acetyltransferase)